LVPTCHEGLKSTCTIPVDQKCTPIAPNHNHQSIGHHLTVQKEKNCNLHCATLISEAHHILGQIGENSYPSPNRTTAKLHRDIFGCKIGGNFLDFSCKRYVQTGVFIRNIFSKKKQENFSCENTCGNSPSLCRIFVHE